MIINVQTEEGILNYDVSKINDEKTRLNAKAIIAKVGTLDVITEALSFASATHRGSLETLLKSASEALVENEDMTNEDSNESE